MREVTPTLFCISIHFQNLQISPELLNMACHDYVCLLNQRLGITFDFVRTSHNLIKLYCSCSYPPEEPKKTRIEAELKEVLEKIFSLFEDKKTPIEIQWEHL